MLLSAPTWIIHLLTVSEWFAAMLLFARYGRAIDSAPLRLFALCMVPHLLAGLSILLFHAGGDRWDVVLAVGRGLTFVGSVCLLAATFSMLPLRSARRIWWLVPVVLVGGLVHGATNPEGVRGLLPLTNVLYLVFLVALVFVRRADPQLFSWLSVGGFWFLLVFVAVTIHAQHLAVDVRGLPSLSHADLLHGGSEAFLSTSNLMIALGALLQLKRHERRRGMGGAAVSSRVS